MNASWRTTVAGVGAILAALGQALVAQFDADPATSPEWGIFVSLVIAALGLLAARDNKVSSEQAKAK